jgi:hypothetical protein
VPELRPTPRASDLGGSAVVAASTCSMRIEVATDYHPRLTKWHVRRALKWISAADLAGIDSIRLLKKSPDAVDTDQAPVYLRGVFNPGDYTKVNEHAHHVSLYTQELYLGLPRLLRLTPVATLRVSFVLSHEIGHHLIAHRGYIHEPTEKYKPGGIYDENKESMADNYEIGRAHV